MASAFLWFVWALAVTLSNIILAIVIVYYLGSQKKLNINLTRLKDAAFYYAIGMTFSIIWAFVIYALV